jgi:tetratricopeptide (TPR) repeat protein
VRRVVGYILLLGFAATLGAYAQQEVFSTEEICRKNYQTGIEYKKNLKYRDAQEFFTLVVETCPEMLEAYLQLGWIQTHLEAYEDAIDTYERGLEVAPRNLDLKEGLAYALGAAGQLDRSIRLYQEILDEDPSRTQIFRNLAFLYEKQGKWVEAFMMYKKALAASPDDTELLRNLARKALDQKLYLEAMNLYEKLYEALPEDLGVLRILGYFYYKVHLPEKAIPIYRKVLEREPESPTSLFEHKVLALCLKQAKRPQEAAEEYEYIIQKEPEKLENYYNLAFMYIDMGAFDKAEATVERGLQQDPTYVCLHYARGKSYEARAEAAEKAEDFDSAIAWYEKAAAAFQKCAGQSFCGSQCRGEVDRQEQLVVRAKKQKRKKELEGGSVGSAGGGQP